MIKQGLVISSGILVMIIQHAISFSPCLFMKIPTIRRHERPDSSWDESDNQRDEYPLLDEAEDKINEKKWGIDNATWIVHQKNELLDQNLLNIADGCDQRSGHVKFEFDENDDEDEEDGFANHPISLEDLMSLNTKITNIAYFYLQNEVGIPEDDMWKITHEAGSILGMTANNLRRKVQLMTRLMDLDDNDVRTMLIRHPAVLHLSAKQNIAPTILFLQRSLDLSREDLRSLIVPFPSILGYSLSNLKSKLNFFLKVCQFSKDEARMLFVAEPKLLTAGVKTGLVPRMHFFISDLKLALNDLRGIVKKNPKVFLFSLEKNLRPKLQFYFIMTLGMDVKSLQTILRKYPQILNYNLENHILPITRYFVQDLFFSNQEFSKILLKFPRLITWSLYKIKHVVGYFRFELGLDASQTKRVLYQAPQVINLNTEETLKPRIAYFCQVFNLTDQEVRQVVTGMPTLAICSIETNLKPKIDFLMSVLGPEELKLAVLLQPTLLGYSLENRIIPRMTQILQANVHPRSITVGIPMKELAFQQWLNGRRSRAVLEPGYDSIRRVKTTEGFRLPEPRAEPKITEPNARIMHWNRPRQIPQSETEKES